MCRPSGFILAAFLAAAPVVTTALADDRASPRMTPDAVLRHLPASTLHRMLVGGAAFLAEVEILIAGHGGADGLTADDIARVVRIERARARALQMQRLMVADLDNDGTLALAEVEALGRVIAARPRGTLLRSFAKGDADHNGALDAAELGGLAQAAALRSLSEAEAGLLESLILCDLDQNGAVSATEVSQVIAAAVQGAATPAKAARPGTDT